MTTLEINLPDSLAKEAERMGLLAPANLQALLREAIRSGRLEKLAQARRRIADSGIAPLTLEDIQAEVAADRLERRNPFTA